MMQMFIKALLTIQSARPVFNSSYVSPMINFQDNDVTFKYAEFQQLEFNDNRVSGTDAWFQILRQYLLII